MKIKFAEERLERVKTGTCPVCMKKTRRKKVFWASVNPYNRDADGKIRTREQIREKLRIESDRWEPDFKHASCADSGSSDA